MQLSFRSYLFLALRLRRSEPSPKGHKYLQYGRYRNKLDPITMIKPMNGIPMLKATSENPGKGLNEERSSTPRNMAQKNRMKTKRS